MVLSSASAARVAGGRLFSPRPPGAAPPFSPGLSPPRGTISLRSCPRRRSPVYAIAASQISDPLAFGPHGNFHLADPLDAASQAIAVGELRDARRRARRDEDAGLERHHLREKADVLAQSADHVCRVRAHRELAVLLDADREVLRIVDLVARDDPWAQSGEGIEPFPDVAPVLPAPPPGIALAEVPANGVAEHVVGRLLFAHVARRFSDHGAQLAFEIHVPGYLRKDHGVARADDGGHGFEKKLRHQLVLGEARAVGAPPFFPHLRPVRPVVRRGGPDRGWVENRRKQFRLRERQGRPPLHGQACALHRRGLDGGVQPALAPQRDVGSPPAFSNRRASRSRSWCLWARKFRTMWSSRSRGAPPRRRSAPRAKPQGASWRPPRAP